VQSGCAVVQSDAATEPYAQGTVRPASAPPPKKLPLSCFQLRRAGGAVTQTLPLYTSPTILHVKQTLRGGGGGRGNSPAARGRPPPYRIALLRDHGHHAPLGLVCPTKPSQPSASANQSSTRLFCVTDAPGRQPPCFGYAVPCAPIQTRRREKIYCGKREGRANAPRGPGQPERASRAAELLAKPPAGGAAATTGIR
jgi:hypothetical protein